ncbi:SGS domain containing protein [Naviculisporaceae sp. PSN 640]
MSATTFGQNGLEAVKNKEWAKAIPLLDKALESSNSPTWLLARAQAHQQLKNLDAALHDAELAYHSAVERGSGPSRKHMIEAQYRRAIIYFRLGRYADSDCCAKWSMLLAEGRPASEDDGVEKNVDENGNYTVTYEQGVADKAGQPNPGNVPGLSQKSKTGFVAEWNRAYVWRSQVLGHLRNLPADHPGRKVNVTKIPAKPEKKKVEQKPVEPADSLTEEELKAAKAELAAPAKPAAPAPEPGSVPDERLKLRADYYQTNQTVTISLFGKDLKKEKLDVQFSSNSVRISPIPREAAPYVVPGTREATSTIILDGEIIPEESRFTATPRKIELVLKKKTPGQKWKRWGEEVIGEWDGATKPPTAAPEERPALTTVAPLPQEPPKPATAPAYPTSSKSGPKDWDKLDDGDDDKDSDVNAFFKNLYKGATPEQQRAMMKSFIESNGTALSTDWNDVSKRKVETIPPEGVVPKKWNE